MRKTTIITILVLLAVAFQNNAEAQISTNRNALTFKFLATDYASPLILLSVVRLNIHVSSTLLSIWLYRFV